MIHAMARFIQRFTKGEDRGLVDGGLYYTKNETGTYSVFKILKTEKKGVHLELFSNQFEHPPEHIDEGALYIAGADAQPPERIGMGHVPISKNSFRRWNARFIQASRVTNEELKGYRLWAETSGRYFE